MHRMMFVLAVLFFQIGSHSALAQTTEFSYDGRVRSGGVPFDGNGLFKFAIVSSDGAICYWSNDGVTLTGDEPTSSVQIAVSNGFFSSIIGDETVSGMAPLDPSIFNTEERVNLRVWFNDGTNGYQQLTPDRSIANPALIGIQSARPLTIYVNPVTGNDRNAGSKPGKAKKTIQAAWDVIPALVNQDVVIQLAPGEYYQSAHLGGKQTLKESRITLRGDNQLSNTVILSGAADHATSSTPVRSHVIEILKNQKLRVQGVQIENGSYAGLHGYVYSDVEISKCRFLHNGFAILQDNFSNFMVDNVSIENGSNTPYMIYAVVVNNSHLEMTNSTIAGKNRTGIGVLASYVGVVYLKDIHIESFKHGVESKSNSVITFKDKGNSIADCDTGSFALLNGTLIAAQSEWGAITYSNVTVPVYTESSGVSGQ